MEEDKPLASISQARSLEELAEFWDTHDATDFDAQTHEVSLEFDLRSWRHYLAIDPEVLTRLREAATARGLSAESLANLWLQERLLTSMANTASARTLAWPSFKSNRRCVTISPTLDRGRAFFYLVWVYTRL